MGLVSGADITEKVTIYSKDASGNPGDELYVLSGTLATGERTFTAPEDATLSANTSYFVHFEDTNTSANDHLYSVHAATDGDTDSGLTGWSLEDRYSKNEGDANPAWAATTGSPLALELKGYANLPANLLVSNTDETEQPLTATSQLGAQRFNTGPNPDGYTVTDVSLKVATISSTDATTITIREHSTNDDAPCFTNCDFAVTLTNPTTFSADTLNVFTAPEDTVPRTRYHLLDLNQRRNSNRQ